MLDSTPVSFYFFSKNIFVDLFSAALYKLLLEICKAQLQTCENIKIVNDTSKSNTPNCVITIYAARIVIDASGVVNNNGTTHFRH